MRWTWTRTRARSLRRQWSRSVGTPNRCRAPYPTPNSGCSGLGWPCARWGGCLAYGTWVHRPITRRLSNGRGFHLPSSNPMWFSRADVNERMVMTGVRLGSSKDLGSPTSFDNGSAKAVFAIQAVKRSTSSSGSKLRLHCWSLDHSVEGICPMGTPNLRRARVGSDPLSDRPAVAPEALRPLLLVRLELSSQRGSNRQESPRVSFHPRHRLP